MQRLHSIPQRGESAKAVTSELVGEAPSLSEIFNNQYEVLHLTRTEGGAIYHLTEGNLLGRNLYAVTVRPELGHSVLGLPELEDVRKFMLLNLDQLANPNYCMGTWYDQRNDRTSMDIMTALESRALAIRFAETGGQDTIWGLATGTPIYVAGSR